ncbi:MAG: hypothetical protein ACE5Z5_05960 [Candidatus Bathyarchaeia archaeon]
MEIALRIYNRMILKGKVSKECEGCPFVAEVGKVMLVARDKQLEKIEEQLGYSRP